MSYVPVYFVIFVLMISAVTNVELNSLTKLEVKNQPEKIITNHVIDRVNIGKDKFFDALWMVESSRSYNPPDGDGGRSIGPYQIQRVYYIDSGINGNYQNCRNKKYSEKVIEGYMLRYAKEAWLNNDFEKLARIHNGGPSGHKKRSTEKYWAKFRQYL